MGHGHAHHGHAHDGHAQGDGHGLHGHGLHDHSHDHSGHHHAPKDFGNAFILAIILNSGFVVVEAAFGFIYGSMALVADAGHNLSDVLALLLAWGASLAAKRPPSERYTYGFKSSTILAAIANAMLLAFAIGAVCKNLGTGTYVASIASETVPAGMIPFLVFVLSCFIAFSTGTSWGTFAIMIPIAVPLAQTMDVNVLMAIAAVMGGGVFGDHCSPISDTTILSSMASASDHIDHVRTQLPYAFLAGGLAALMYLVVGQVNMDPVRRNL